MATIENYIRLRDGFSPALDSISRASNTVSDKLNHVSSVARTAGDAAEEAGNRFSMLKSVFAGSFLAGAAIQGIQAVKDGLNGLVNTADEFAGIQARLGLIAGSQENVAYLNNKIYESAQRARGGYMDMARAVAQLSMSAHDAFPDPRKATDFMEGIQKLFVIGGTSKANQRDAMLQLTQGLASGQLQGDEFRSIAENAPLIENIIAKQMGVSRGALKQLASEGKVTADVIRDAILGNMDEINAQFEMMPKRWGDHFTDLSNVAIKAFAPVFTRLNDLANSDGVRMFVNNISYGIKTIAPMFYVAVGAIQWFVDTAAGAIQYIGDFFNQNAWAAEAVLGALGLALVYVGLNALISAGQMGVAAVATAAKMITDFAETAAIIGLTLAQDGLNAAMYACPVTWIIGAIVILIGIFYAAVAVVNHFAGTSISATGLIFGAFAWLATGIVNNIKFIANGFITFANFLGSVFQDPLTATQNLFIDIWNGIADYVKQAVNGIIDVINLIPGMSKIKVFDHVDLPTLERKEIANAAFYIKPFEYGNANDNAKEAYNLGAGLKDKLKGLMNKDGQDEADQYDESKITPGSQQDPEDKKNRRRTADNTQRIADKLDMTDAEIRELRDATMQPVMAEWQRQSIIINMENHNTIASDVDTDGMTSNFVKGFREALSTHREGVKI